MEALPDLEEEVYADYSVVTTIFEDYEITIEDCWPDFIRDFYE
jgi:hypothetical protein